MRTVLTAFAIGAAAFGVVAVVCGVAVGVAFGSLGRDKISVGLGPLVVLEFSRSARGTETTFGLGIVVVALAGGVVNAAAAASVLRARR